MAPRRVVHKRANSAKLETATTKRAKRQSTKKSTPVKSKYFNEGNGEDEDSSSGSQEQGSDFESEGAEEEEPSSESDAEMSEDAKPKSRGRKSASGQKPQAAAQRGSGRASLSSKDLLRHGKTGLGPGTQVVIKKPKPREAGSTPYRDHTIHPNTMLFLQDLAANNNRPWLKSGFDAFFPLTSHAAWALRQLRLCAAICLRISRLTSWLHRMLHSAARQNHPCSMQQKRIACTMLLGVS